MAAESSSFGEGVMRTAGLGRKPTFKLRHYQRERRPDEHQVEVALTQGFWVGKYAVTQGLWQQVMGPLPGMLSAGTGEDFPVYHVNYSEAEVFCRRFTDRLSASDSIPKSWEFRLPTEARWEYACRAGTTTATAFGDRLSSREANFRGDFPYNGADKGPNLGRTEKVGSYPANAWEVHEMHGNVFEWCRDWYHAGLPGGADPDLSLAKASASVNRDGTVSRVRRGGCWADQGWPCRSACRLRFEPRATRRPHRLAHRRCAVMRRSAPRAPRGSSPPQRAAAS